jgi:hypothetical protein
MSSRLAGVSRAGSLVALCAAIAVTIPACRNDAPEQRAAAASTRYVPLFSRADDRREARGTIRGDFQWASDAATVEDAASRWRNYLTEHNPPGQEYEDSVHASYVHAAQYELARVYYLLGRRDEGDALLNQLDPVGWRQ